MMKTLTKYLNEKLIINKNYNDPHTCAPTSWEELRNIIKYRYDKLGPGINDKPINFNDVDVSNIDSFYDKHTYNGLFENTAFEYIDVSYWDVSKAKDMSFMFSGCKQLKSVGNLSNWNVSNVKSMSCMFFYCEKIKSVGDLSNWNVSRVRFITGMFQECEQLKSVGDLSKWNVSRVEDMVCTFKDSGITNVPKWYKK